jgi:transcription-repair coupling factor (superfamily II helicase)
MRDMADDLLANTLMLQYEQTRPSGHCFPNLSPGSSRKFEYAFPYAILTTDQQPAIEIQKRTWKPLTYDRPENRLNGLGYGKTEVAMWAAFKAVMDGRTSSDLTPRRAGVPANYETFKEAFVAAFREHDLLSVISRTIKIGKTVRVTGRES